MQFRLMLGILAMSLIMVGSASAAVDSAAEFLEMVQTQVDRGELTADEALLIKFQYAFDREKLPEQYQPTWKAPMKCGTPLVMEFMQSQGRMDSEIAATIEGYLTLPEGNRLNYWAPSHLFRLNYQVSGSNAVPPADDNANGVPDYVELVAEYMDYSLDYECNTLGFSMPPFQADAAYMTVTLQNLDGIYGYTQPVGYPTGMTHIVLDNDFVGYAPNDDPDGNELGAAKVTAAHEFKHSTQYVGSNWSEGGWNEVDATWAEEIVYPMVNDYLNYLPFGSPISSPTMALDGGSTGTGSYEDCVWQHYMSQTHGIQFVVDYYDYRKTHQGQAVMDSYEQMFATYGSDLNIAWANFTAWNFACGARSLADAGYEEDDLYPTGSAQKTMYVYPDDHNGYVAHLAANFIRCLSVDDAGKNMKITFNGNDNARMTLSAVVNVSYSTHAGVYYTIPLDSNNDAVFQVPYDLDGVYSVGFVVGNAAKTGTNMSYSVDIEQVDAVVNGVGDEVPSFTIAGNYPNPFNPSTAIKFNLSGAAATQLDIFDLSGRKVRTLVQANLGAGEHTVRWNGQDDSGRSLASGTYLAKLRSGEQVTTHKLVLAK